MLKPASIEVALHDHRSYYSTTPDYISTAAHGGVEDEVKAARYSYSSLGARIDDIVGGVTGLWNIASGVVYPSSNAYKVAIGGDTSSAPFYFDPSASGNAIFRRFTSVVFTPTSSTVPTFKVRPAAAPGTATWPILTIQDENQVDKVWVDYNWKLWVAGDIASSANITGGNVTSGADPGHTHTGASLSGIDISSDTNLGATLPLALSGDAVTVTGLSSLGTSNYVAGVNNGATGWEYKNIVGTASEIDITHAANSITIGLVDPLALSKGGTGKALTAANGGIVYSDADSLEILTATATANKVLLSGSSTLPAWSTPTYPNTATSGKVLIGDGTNIGLSTPTFPNASATSGKFIISDGTNWIASTPTHPNTATLGKILIGDGTNWIESTPKYPNASATAGKIIRSDGTDYAASTSTFADTYAISTILYAGTANIISGLATGNSGILVTSGAGVPSIGTDIPIAVTIGSAYIYRVGGTDVTIVDGGTGASVASTAFNNLSPMTTLGDVIYGAASGAGTRLAGNNTTTRKFLRQVGDGANSAAPGWDTVTASDVGGAPLASPFVTIGNDGTLTGERALTGTTNQIIVVDNGANSTVILSTPQSIHTGASPTFAGLSLGTGGLNTVGTITPAADSTYNLGTSTPLYFANAYIDRIYLNSTAYLDGATAGKIQATGSLGIGVSPTSLLHTYQNPLNDTTNRIGNYLYQQSRNDTVALINATHTVLLVTGDTSSGYAWTGQIGIQATVGPNWGPVTNVYAFYAYCRTQLNWHSITSAYNFYAASPSVVTNSLITDAYGLYVAAQKVANVTRGWGIYVDDASAGNTMLGWLNVGPGTAASAAGQISATSAAVIGTSGIVIGEDKVTPTANTAGVLKLISAGDNAFYTTLTAGTQTANAGYTLPTASPTSDGYVLSSTTGGTMSWVAAVGIPSDSANGCMIMMWSGTGANIPSGWLPCNGVGNTPDLRSKFIRGAVTNAGATGGSDTHALTAYEMPVHSHAVTVDNESSHTHSVPYIVSGAGAVAQGTNLMESTTASGAGSAHTHTASIGNAGSGGPHNNMPAYYELIFVAKD